MPQAHGVAKSEEARDATDVLVVGGGMVGAMTALAFARCNINVTVVEKQPPSDLDSQAHDTLSHDIRVSAISHATLQMFKSVGAWDGMQRIRACPYTRMLVWDESSTAETRFNSADAGFQQLGFIVENRVIQHALWEQLHTLDNVTVKCPASVESLDLQPTAALVQLDNGEQLQAALVVAADGSQSSVRDLAGIAVDGEAYQQHALVATVRTELPQQDITWQRFTSTGPQAFLPLMENRASMVWYHTQERVAELKALAEGDFIAAMQDEFPERLGGILSVEQTGSFPLSWSHAQQYVLPRFALVGDAAHAVHPLAGQGVNLGMLDAASLVQCVVDQVVTGRDPGDMRALRRYERWRKPSNEMMIRMLDGIQKAFQPPQGSELQNGILKLARTSALRVADKVGPINKACIRNAMGMSGELPAFVRGRLPTQAGHVQ